MVNFNFSSIIELVETFRTELDCYTYLEKIRWSNGVVCPVCGATHKEANFWRLADKKTYKCSKCRKRFNVKTGTVFQESRLSLRKWFMAIFFLTTHSKGISSVQLAKDLNIPQKTAWFLAHRIRYVAENFKAKTKFNRPVEVDETYVGGKNRFKHKNKKVAGTQGRNTINKTAVLGFTQRKTKYSSATVLAYKVNDVSHDTLNYEVTKNVKKGIKVFTDEWRGYSKLKYQFNHQFIKHKIGNYVNGEVHTNTIEGFWSIFKRMYTGIYHYISKKHLNRYLDTLSFRYNHMKLKSSERFELFLSRCYGRLSYKELVF